MQYMQDIPEPHLLINPCTNHKFTDFSEDFIRLSIAFDIQCNEHTLTENDSYTIDSSSQQITNLLEKMLDEYTNRNLGYKNIVNFHIQTALIEFLRSSPDILFSENKKIDFSQNTFKKITGLTPGKYRANQKIHINS